MLLLISTTIGAVILRTLPAMFFELTKIGQGSVTAMMLIELSMAMAVLIFPTMAMGYAFSHLSCQVRGSLNGFGRAIAVNTFGGMSAPGIIGVGMLPVFGLKTMLVGCSLGYCVLLILPGFNKGVLRSKRIIVSIAFSLVIGLMFIPGTSYFTHLRKGDTILEVVDGVMASCMVLGDQYGGKHLFFNSRFQEGGTMSPLADGREAVIPLLLHPDPKDALFLGVGAGITFNTAGWFKNVQADGVELISEMKMLLKHFIRHPIPENCTFIGADARRYTAVCKKKYDVIVADLYHPARDGAGYLYTKEHFISIKNCLSEKGIFCQWLPLYQMDEKTLCTIMRTFTTVFSDAAAWLVNYSVEMPILGLIGSFEPVTIHPRRIETIQNNTFLKKRLESLKFYSTITLAGGFLGNEQTIKNFAGEGVINTDNFPKILFEAPSFVYGSQIEKPSEMLNGILNSFETDTHKLFTQSDSTSLSRTASLRLIRYRKARDRFIRMGINVARSGRIDDRNAFVDSLFSFVEASSDFEGAYNPLLGIALQVSQSNPYQGLLMLKKLDALSSDRNEARSLINKLEIKIAPLTEPNTALK